MDLVGQTFGRLKVKYNNPIHKGYVICECECGAVKSIRATQLTKKEKPTRSCGCIQRECARKIGTNTVTANSFARIERDKTYNTNINIIASNKPNKANKSGVKGVYWNEKIGKWEAYINLHRQKIHLGKFREKEDAIKARRVAEEKYFEPILREAIS